MGVPAPGTGAWTGAIIAYLLDMPFTTAMASILAGVVVRRPPRARTRAWHARARMRDPELSPCASLARPSSWRVAL